MQPMYPVKNTRVTQITADITTVAQIISVADVSVFPAPPNYVTIGTDNGAEVIFYAGIDVPSNALTGCLRGQSGTLPATWEAGSDIYHAWTADTANNIMGNVRANDEAIAQTAEALGTHNHDGAHSQKIDYANIHGTPGKLYRQCFTGSATLLAANWAATPEGRFAQTITVTGMTATMGANVFVADADWQKISQNGAKTECMADGITIYTADLPTDAVEVTYEVWEVVQ